MPAFDLYVEADDVKDLLSGLAHRFGFDERGAVEAFATAFCASEILRLLLRDRLCAEAQVKVVRACACEVAEKIYTFEIMGTDNLN